ncbi:MAG: serine/threonine protein kinase [Pseudomonadales bacterium]|nr:serine/threonine protein kinase [Pseudomonadales bacterium]
MDANAIPGYKILHRLGQGGMATVYLAEELKLKRKVALKILNTEQQSDDCYLRRFMAEARIIASLSQPNIINVYAIGQHENLNYIAMQYLPGGNLKDKLSQGISLNDALDYIREVATGLHYAGEHHYIHRDIKPDNILFDENGCAVISDFGIARSIQSQTRMTINGAVIGTPSYMSPEQVEGHELDHRSDLYSLGILIYEMLTGTLPFKGTSMISIGVKHVIETPPLLPVQYRAFQAFMNKALAKKACHRFQNGAEMINALNRIDKGTNKHYSGLRLSSNGINPATENREFLPTCISVKCTVFKSINWLAFWQNVKLPMLAMTLASMVPVAVYGFLDLAHQHSTAVVESQTLVELSKPVANDGFTGFIIEHVDDEVAIKQLLADINNKLLLGQILQPYGNNALSKWLQLQKMRPFDKRVLQKHDDIISFLAEANANNWHINTLSMLQQDLTESQELSANKTLLISMQQAINKTWIQRREQHMLEKVQGIAASVNADMAEIQAMAVQVKRALRRAEYTLAIKTATQNLKKYPKSKTLQDIRDQALLSGKKSAW